MLDTISRGHPVAKPSVLMPVAQSAAPSQTPPEAEEDLRIGAILRSKGKMTADQVERTLREQSLTPDQRFGDIAVRLGFIKAADVTEALAIQFGYPQVVAPAGGELTVSSGSVIAASRPYMPFVEALRGLRSQLMMNWFDGTPGQTSIAITSVDRGDGKSFIAANLGVIFAQLGEHTLIIDADLRHPTQHQIFGLPNKMGLSGLLSGRAGLEEVSSVAGIPNLSVLPSGPLPPNPQELLGRPVFAALLNQFSTVYSVIIIDTPSAQEASDAQVISLRAGGALIVGRKNRTRSSEITQLAQILTRSGVKVLGATLNEP